MARRRNSSDKKSPESKGRSEQTKKTGGEGKLFASTVSEQLIKDVANFSFAAPTGSKMRLAYPGGGTALNNAGIPGIMGIRWLPTIGWSDSPTSPANIAARALMTRVRAANSGLRNYDQNALMTYIMAIDSAYLWLAHMKRIYGLAMTSNPVNKYLPEMLVQTTGADYQDLLLNISDFRAYINTYAARLYSLPVPKIPVISRHQDMSANVYLDSESGKAQMYIFVPEALYIYGFDAPTSSGTLTCTRTPFCSDFLPTDTQTPITTMTVAELKSFGESILQPILITYGEEDFALIGGDILKAFGEDGVYRPSGITEDYSVMPIYDELMLHRIMNSTAYGFNSVEATPVPNTTFDVILNVGSAPVSAFLQSKPVVTADQSVFGFVGSYMDNHILNSSSGPMDPATSLEVLAFQTIPTDHSQIGTTNSFRFNLGNVGTEYITRYVFYYMLYSGATPSLRGTVSVITPFMMVATYSSTSENAQQVADNVGDARDKLSIMEQFDFHPILHPLVSMLDADQFTAGTWQRVGFTLCEFLFGDVNTYTEITAGDLGRIRNIKTLVDLGL